MTETQGQTEIRVSTPDGSVPPADGLSVERLRTIIQDSHVSFLLGAGTSARYFEQLGPVETVLTELGQDSDEARLARASVEGFFFDKVLRPNIPLMEHDTSAQSLIKSYGRFVAVLNRLLLKRRSTILSKQVNLFTTNVDMAFEVALEMLEIDANDGFMGKIEPRLDLGQFSTLRFRQGTRFEYRSEIPVMNVFKIHGSAAWRQAGDEIYFDSGLGQIKAAAALFDKAKSDLLPIASRDKIVTADLLAAATGRKTSKAVDEFVDAYRQLSIVNPEKSKFATTVLNKTYYELLRRLANELEKENSALFVHGFSFRDEHLLDLVLRAAATNPTLQVVVFCYSREARVEISSLFPEEKLKNGNVLLVQPSSPEASGDERFLTLDVLVEDYLANVLNEPVAQADHIIELKLSGSAEAPHA